jgi:hypothetical protein
LSSSQIESPIYRLKLYKSKVIPTTNNHVVYFVKIFSIIDFRDTLDPPRTAGETGFHYFSKLCSSFQFLLANNNQNISPLGKN